MATHSSIVHWKIPWTEAPGGLQSMGYKESHGKSRLARTPRSPIKEFISLWGFHNEQPFGQ